LIKLIFQHQKSLSNKKLAMISLSHLNKFKLLLVFFVALIFSSVFAEEEAIDIWQDKENQNRQNTQIDSEKNITIESPILSDDINKIVIKIEENEIGDQDRSVIGIFDPEENNFNLNMWSQSDGEDIKKILKRINKLNLSPLSEDLLFQILFTNAYPPTANLNSEEFLKIKINWLIEKKRIKNLVTLVRFRWKEYMELLIILLLVRVPNQVIWTGPIGIRNYICR